MQGLTSTDLLSLLSNPTYLQIVKKLLDRGQITNVAIDQITGDGRNRLRLISPLIGLLLLPPESKKPRTYTIIPGLTEPLRALLESADRAVEIAKSYGGPPTYTGSLLDILEAYGATADEGGTILVKGLTVEPASDPNRYVVTADKRKARIVNITELLALMVSDSQ